MQRSRSIATSGESSSGLRKWRLGSTKREWPPPQPKVMSCSGHSPPLSQTGQSSGWLISRNSTTERWASLTRSAWVSPPVLDGGRTAGLELGNPLDFDQAHAAGTDRLAEFGLVAEDGDLDIAVFG